MDATQVQMLTVGGVLAIVIAGVVVNGAYARREMAARRARSASPQTAAPGFVGKYAVHDGAVVGRVVAVEGDILVLEQAGVRRKVPLSAAKEQGADVVLSRAPEAA